MEKIFELAKDLGDALLEHPIGKRYSEARSKLDTDTDARKLISDFEQTATRLQQKEKQGNPIEPEEKRTLAELQGKLAGNDAVKKYMEAQVEYLNLLRQINELVMKEKEVESSK